MKSLILISTLFFLTQKWDNYSGSLKNLKYYQEDEIFTTVENPPSFPSGQAE